MLIDARAVIFYTYFYRFLICVKMCANGQYPFFAGVFTQGFFQRFFYCKDGIVGNVNNNLLYLAAIHHRVRDTGIKISHNVNLLFSVLLFHNIEYIVDQLIDI